MPTCKPKKQLQVAQQVGLAAAVQRGLQGGGGFHGFQCVGQVASLSSLIAEDASFVECSDAERAGLASLFAVFNNMQQGAAEGSKTFAKGGLASKDFASTFTKLAQANNEQVSQDGVSFADLNSFVSKCFSDNAQIVQRIADKELNAKRQQQAAAEEAARQENEARKAAAAAARRGAPAAHPRVGLLLGAPASARDRGARGHPALRAPRPVRPARRRGEGAGGGGGGGAGAGEASELSQLRECENCRLRAADKAGGLVPSS